MFFNITKPVSDAHPKISAIELNVNVNPRKNLKSIRDFNCPQSQKKTKLFFSLHNVALTRLWSYFYCTIVSYYCHLFSNPFPVVTKHVTTGCVQLTYSKIIFPYTKIKSFFSSFSAPKKSLFQSQAERFAVNDLFSIFPFTKLSEIISSSCSLIWFMYMATRHIWRKKYNNHTKHNVFLLVSKFHESEPVAKHQ